MTWVIATASVIFGAMVGDVRLTRREGTQSTPLSVGLRKVHLFSGRTACGFAGDVRRAWHALESVNSYIRVNGQDDPKLVDQVKEWMNHLYERQDPLSSVAEHRTELLLVRTRRDPAVNIIVAQGVRANLAWSGDDNPRVRSFFLMDHIGSGTEIAAYRRAVEEIRRQLPGLGGFEQAAPGKGFIGHIFASGLSDIIAKSPEVTVSPDVDVCVLSAAGAWFAESRRGRPPLTVCKSLAELETRLGTLGGAALIG